MFTKSDIESLRASGKTDREIMQMTARVIPSAAKALIDLDADKTTPALKKDQILKQMIDKNAKDGGISMLPYVSALTINSATKKHDALTKQYENMDQPTSQQRAATAVEKLGDPLGRVAGGLMRIGEYISSPLSTASGLTEKALLPQSFEGESTNIQELNRQGSMARTSLPLSVGLMTAPLSIPAGAVATGLAGFAGRGMQETASAVTGQDNQSALGRIGESIKEGVVTGVTDAAFGAAGRLIGKAGKRLLSPLAGRFNDEIAALATKKGIDLPLSSLSDSNAVKQAEALSQKGIFGGKLETVVDTANKKLSDIADSFVTKFGGSQDMTISGKSVLEGANTFRDAWRTTKNKAYAKAAELLKSGDSGGFMPDTTETVKVIDEILSGKQAASEIIGDAALSDTTTGILQTIRKNLTSGETKSLQAFTSALDELNKMTKFGNTLISTGDQGILKKVIATMDQDVTNGLRSIAPKVAAALDEADAIYKNGIELLDSSFGTKIAKLSDNPTKIVDQLITPKSVDDVPRIFELIGKGKDGPKRIADVQSSFARKLLDKATGQDGIIGKTLDSQINTYGESTVRAVLGDDGLQAIREIQKLASAINEGQKVAAGSQTAFLGKTQAFLTALFTGNIPVAAGIAGGDKILSGLFQTGWFRTWLTKGFEATPLMKGAASVGGEAMQRAGVGLSQVFTSNEQ